VTPPIDPSVDVVARLFTELEPQPFVEGITP
jgi:hypothetical protein